MFYNTNVMPSVQKKRGWWDENRVKCLFLDLRQKINVPFVAGLKQTVNLAGNAGITGMPVIRL